MFQAIFSPSSEGQVYYVAMVLPGPQTVAFKSKRSLIATLYTLPPDDGLKNPKHVEAW
jgi:hypothetical protein